MKQLAIILLLFFSSLESWSKPKYIQVQGQKVYADNIEYYSNTKKIISFSLVNPATFSFPRNNKIRADQTVFLHLNGKISSLFVDSDQIIDWIKEDHSIIKLNCGVKFDSINLRKVARAVRFYESGEYYNGCSTTEKIQYKNPTHDSLIQVEGVIDVTPDFKILYAEKSYSAQLNLNSLSKVKLEDGKEIAFHTNGKPRFFTMKQGEYFKLNHPTYGEIKLIQKSDKLVSTYLYEDGSLDKGVIGQTLLFKPLEMTISIGTGIGFFSSQSHNPNDIQFLIFDNPTEIKLKKYQITIRNLVVLESGYRFTTAEVFKYINEPTNEEFSIPAGSLVTVSPDLEIVLIQTYN